MKTTAYHENERHLFKTRYSLEALSNTLEIADKVEFYSIDHGPIMPTFAIPEEFGTEEEYRQKFTEQDLFDEFTHRDENGNVVLSMKRLRTKKSRN